MQVVTDESHGTARAVYTINEGEKGAVREIQLRRQHQFQ